MRRKPGRLPATLVFSVILHAVVLACLSHTIFPSGAQGVGRYTRVRLVRWDAGAPVPRRLQVSLPGVRVRPTPLPAGEAQAPPSEEALAQMRRITALRADFFHPMSLRTLPMPVLPAPPDMPLPPLWDAPLPNTVAALPALPVDAGRQQLARLLRGGPAVSPPKPSVSAPQAVADLLASRLALSLSEPLPTADSGFGVPEGAGLLNEEKHLEARAQTEVALGGGLGLEPAPSAVTMPDERRTPGDAGGEQQATPAATTSPDPTAEPPAAGEQDPGAAPPDARTPDTVALAKPSKENVGDAPAAAEAPAELARAEDASPAAADAGASREPSGSPKPETPALRPRPVADGPHAGVKGSYPVPLGIALPSYRSSVSMVALIREVNARTGLRLLPRDEVAPEAVSAETPLLYVKGTGKLELTHAQRAALKAYVEGGGTILVDGATEEFGQSARAELDRIFARPPADIPASHPLYGAYYRLNAAKDAKLFPLQAIEVDGRPAVLLSPTFLGRRWQSTEDPDHEAAVALGVNLVAYAVAKRPVTGDR